MGKKIDFLTCIFDPSVFPALFHIRLLPIKLDKKSFMNQNQTCPCSMGLGFK